MPEQFRGTRPAVIEVEWDPNGVAKRIKTNYSDQELRSLNSQTVWCNLKDDKEWEVVDKILKHLYFTPNPVSNNLNHSFNVIAWNKLDKNIVCLLQFTDPNFFVDNIKW